jgi:hypothetical protein
MGSKAFFFISTSKATGSSNFDAPPKSLKMGVFLHIPDVVQ